MTNTQAIDAELTVNEAIRRFPETVAVFNDFGIDACCGGAASLAEAAARDGANPQVLLAAVRATRVLHDEPNLRVIAFHLLPGQAVPPHRNASTVLVQVITGRGRFVGDDTDATLEAGEAAVYRPGETHFIEALDEPLVFHAVIAPRPGGEVSPRASK
jgi:regulator of cell morphogenesis and NO signaling